MIFLSILREDSDLSLEIFNYWQPELPAGMASHRRIARALLHDLLTTGMRLPRETYRLISDDSGRPLLQGNGPLPGISISHSVGWIGCAAQLSPAVIGLDLEVEKAGRDHLELASAAFGPAETAAVRDAGTVAFYRFWTLREAWAKAHGLGFASLADRHDHVPPQFLGAQAAAVVSDATAHWWGARLRSDLHFALVSLKPRGESENMATATPAPVVCIHRVSPDLSLEGLSFREMG